jgi:hypothetical protein
MYCELALVAVFVCEIKRFPVDVAEDEFRVT